MKPVRLSVLLTAARMAGADVGLASEERKHGNARWGYQGDVGPSHWGALGYALCSEGKNQSPEGFDKSASALLDAIDSSYSPSPIEAVNNGHTVQFNYRPGSHITVSGKQYELLQFHFHSSSENTVTGKPYAMEVHLMHKSADGALAVVRVFLGAGWGDALRNGTLSAIFDSLPEEVGTQVTGDTSIKAADLLPPDRSYRHFMGSLNTPPCSEGVSWFVMNDPIRITPDQLARFRALYDGNARPVKPWTSRDSFERTAANTAGAFH